MKHTVKFLREYTWDTDNSNIDIIIETESGRYCATLFTLSNVVSLMNKYRESGECCSGAYFWAADMIIVKDLSIETINKTVADIIENEWLEKACMQLPQLG